MPSIYYKRNFATGSYYHIFNRGSHKSSIFREPNDYETFLEIIEYYQRFPTGKPLSLLTRFKETNPSTNIKVPNLDKISTQSSFSIICYCLMPNHYHLLLHQGRHSRKENSITNFMRRLSITYSMYFNQKYKHSGNLLQGKYKCVYINTESQLLYLTKYIHRNPIKILGKQKLIDYKYSSYPSYLLNKPPFWLISSGVLSYFTRNNPNLSYQTFIEEPLDQTQKRYLESVTLE